MKNKTISLREYYHAVLKIAKHIGMEKGYAIAVHGSMTRDLDIVAIPWQTGCSTPRQFADSLKNVTGGGKIGFYDKDQKSIHGYFKYSIALPLSFESGEMPYIDMTVIPPRKKYVR